MSEDGVCQSHHLYVCLSAHSEPSAAILSLNYCNQHIPANHTHACMHTRTCVLNSKHLNMKHCRPHKYPDITPSQDVMAHIFPAESTNNIWSKITHSLKPFVTWWGIASAHFHISHISLKLFKPLPVMLTHLFLTLEQNAALSFAELSEEQMNLKHSWRVLEFFLTDSC